MEVRFVALVTGLILASLGLLHVYWGVAGVRGDSVVVPEVDCRPLFQPGRTACFVVAAALGVAAVLVLWRGGLVHLSLPAQASTAGSAAVGAAFLLRAIGDFRLVGFTKKVRGTRFAAWDTRLFSPLCLFLGACSLLVAFS